MSSHYTATHGNRNYKDSLFRMLFKEPKNTLSLYNALHGTHYTDPSLVQIYTIESALFISYKNDVAFLLDDYLNLYEHQSTFNPNMPLRGLFYFAQSYERYFRENNLSRYGSKLIKIPTPRYYIFYNGSSDFGPKKELHLSDAFINTEGSAGYEWTATYININSEENRELVEACRPLFEYSVFVAKVKQYILEEDCNLDKALQNTIYYCKANRILDDFLLANEEAVMGWFLEAYMDEEERRIVAKEYLESAFKEGRVKGLEEGKAEALFYAVSLLMEKQAVSDEEACSLLNVPIDDYRNYLAKEGK